MRIAYYLCFGKVVILNPAITYAGAAEAVNMASSGSVYISLPELLIGLAIVAVLAFICWLIIH